MGCMGAELHSLLCGTVSTALHRLCFIPESTLMPRRYPLQIPEGTSVPAWAYLDFDVCESSKYGDDGLTRT